MNGILYNTFRDACYALGLLDDDREFVDAVNEASFWGSGHYLRKLFVTMLLSCSVSRPEFVWDQTWEALCEDILYLRHRILAIEGKFPNLCIIRQ